MDIKSDIKKFYNAEAKKYASTRKKHRSDAPLILEKITGYGKKNISILEFGCGSGRLLDHLKELKGIKITYTGVDISNQLIAIAKKNAPKSVDTTFICDDISHYIKSCEQESFDFVIGIGSFQHMPTNKERCSLIKNFYRILKYGGKLMMTNRALSKRFLQRYTYQTVKSFLKFLISGGKYNARDIMVPRKSGNTIYHRFYHFFSLKELEKLAHMGGFIIQQLSYSNKDGTTNSSWMKANNSFIISEKKIFKE